MKTVGFIDYYLDEFHANNYPKWLKEASGGELEVKYAYAKIDSPLQGGMTTDDWCEKYGIERVSSIEELIEKSDYINVLSPDNPEMHEELCHLPLKSGKRVYVDKTFSETKEIAERIFKLAEENKGWRTEDLRKLPCSVYPADKAAVIFSELRGIIPHL